MYEKVFPSKIGVGLLIILIIAYLGSILQFILGQREDMWLLVVLSVFYIFVFYMFFTIKYVVKDNVLIVKYSFLAKKVIEISSISKMEESRSILASPASSMDRLEILYNKMDSIIISPKEKELFIEELLKINPSIVVKYRQK